jgi:hypothetical protein
MLPSGGSLLVRGGGGLVEAAGQGVVAGWSRVLRGRHWEARTEPTRGPEVLRTVQTTVRSPADQAPASG